MRNVRHTLFVLLALAALAGPAHAASSDVIRDCARDGKLDKKYSQSELKNARGDLPTDVDEYTNCREAIASGLRGSGGPKAGVSSNDGGGGGDVGRPTDTGSRGDDSDDIAALDDAAQRSRSDEAPELSVGDQRITPGEGGLFGLSNAANKVPLPLILVLASLALLAAGGGFYMLRRRGLAGIGPGLKQRMPDMSRVANLFRRRD